MLALCLMLHALCLIAKIMLRSIIDAGLAFGNRVYKSCTAEFMDEL